MHLPVHFLMKTVFANTYLLGQFSTCSSTLLSVSLSLWQGGQFPLSLRVDGSDHLAAASIAKDSNSWTCATLSSHCVCSSIELWSYNANFLTSTVYYTVYYSYARLYHWGKLSKGYIGTSSNFFFNFLLGLQNWIGTNRSFIIHNWNDLNLFA